MRIRTACLLCAILVVAAPGAKAQTRRWTTRVHNIHLKEKGDISDAAAVNDAINVMVRNVASCGQASAKDSQACACSFKDDLKKLRAVYNTAVGKHPAWKEDATVISYEDPASGKSVTINLPGVKRQLEACAQR